MKKSAEKIIVKERIHFRIQNKSKLKDLAIYLTKEMGLRFTMSDVVDYLAEHFWLKFIDKKPTKAVKK